MKLTTYLVLAAVIALPLATMFAQSNTKSQPSAPALSPGGAEVAQLAQSGVGDDVILGFINHSQVYYNLTAAEIVALKNSGVSPKAVTAMLNHDVTLHNQQLASGARPVTTTESIGSATPPRPHCIQPRSGDHGGGHTAANARTANGRRVGGPGTAARGSGSAAIGVIRCGPDTSGTMDGFTMAMELK